MKITRGQLRALVERTRGYVDELECELEELEDGEVMKLKFHHIHVLAHKDGKYAVFAGSELLDEGQIEPITNQGWSSVRDDSFRSRGW